MKIQSGNNTNITSQNISVSRNDQPTGQSVDAVAPIRASSIVSAEGQLPEQLDQENGQQASLEEIESRLIIEKNEETGSYVYITINRKTGQVIQQLPREKLLQVVLEKHGSSGLIVNQKA